MDTVSSSFNLLKIARGDDKPMFVKSASLMTTVLLTFCLLLLVSCGSKAVASSAPTPTATRITPKLSEMGMWYWVQMMNSSTGWISAKNGILRTTDGGTHWTPVFQCAAKPSSIQHLHQCRSFFHSTTSATITPPASAGPNESIVSPIFHTTDGGRTWQHSVINANLVGRLSFVDAMHGWVLASGKDGFLLYQTIDGGKSWHKLSPGPQNHSIMGMTFQNASSGWITDTTFEGKLNSIIHTRDGGKTWQPVVLSFPKDSSISAVTFFNQRDGFFLLNGINASAGGYTTTIYVTRDGGKTWKLRGSVPYYLSNEDFLDLDHIWGISGRSGEKALYATSDGEKHWKKLPWKESFDAIMSKSFVSPTVGFILAGQLGPYSGPDGLFKTIDGGRTWQLVVKLQPNY